MARNCPWCGSEWWNGEWCAECGADEGCISRGQIRYTPERTRKTQVAKDREASAADSGSLVNDGETMRRLDEP